ncbi:hypothetical protein Ancab_018689 [Ancistrocladus abbreviatus]
MTAEKVEVPKVDDDGLQNSAYRDKPHSSGRMGSNNYHFEISNNYSMEQDRNVLDVELVGGLGSLPADCEPIIGEELEEGKEPFAHRKMKKKNLGDIIEPNFRKSQDIQESKDDR